MRTKRSMLAVAIAGSLGFQGMSQDVKLEKGTEVRVASSALSPGWHEGTVTTASMSQTRMCYGVSVKMPNSRTGKAVALFEGVDSIDVKVKLSAADSAAKKSPWKRLDAKALKDKYPACKGNP